MNEHWYWWGAVANKPELAWAGCHPLEPIIRCWFTEHQNKQVSMSTRALPIELPLPMDTLL